MNYYTSDIHLGYKNKQWRPDGADELIIQKWNKKVTNADHVYILGDSGEFGSSKVNEATIQKLSILKGNKHLILGNHDEVKDARVKQLFVEITSYKELQDSFGGKNYHLVLSHFPILMWNGQHKGWILLYGHLHATDEEKIFQDSIKMLNEYFKYKELKGRKDCPPAVAYNMGCMLWDYEPVSLKEILSQNGNK